MDFLNKAKSSIANAGKDLTQKASDAGGLAKVTAHIFEVEKEYKEIMKQLAEAAYEQKYSEMKAMFPEIIAALDNNRADYEKSRKEQAVLKGMRICPNCGAEQDKLAVRCTVCGINMEDAEKTIAANANTKAFCPKCGSELVAGAKFCMGCGNPIG